MQFRPQARAATASSASRSRSRSSGLTSKPSMPAARQAARSSLWALAVSASMRTAPVAGRGLGGADAAGGFQPVHARHLHVHQHQIVRRAGGARGGPGFHRGFAVAGDGRTMAEPGEQRAREQRVDLVVFGDQDRQAFMPRLRGVRLAGSGNFRRHVFERLRGGEPRGERGHAHRLDQIAGEAALLERGQFVPLGRPDQDDAPRPSRRARSPWAIMARASG